MKLLQNLLIKKCSNVNKRYNNNRKYCNTEPPNLSELTPMIFITGLTDLGSETSICKDVMR